VQSIYTLTSSKAQAPEQGEFTVKPRLSPSSGTLVLDSNDKLSPLTSMFSMELKASVLLLQFSSTLF
jgi:hypothetical protein